jgi:hypothetical protein
MALISEGRNQFGFGSGIGRMTLTKSSTSAVCEVMPISDGRSQVGAGAGNGCSGSLLVYVT